MCSLFFFVFFFFHDFSLYIFRTPLALYIGIDSIKAVTKDGKIVMLSAEEQELKDFLSCQVSKPSSTKLYFC